MTDRELYVISVPTSVQTNAKRRGQQKTAVQGLLNSDSGSVQPIATKPGEKDIRFEYRGQYAEKIVSELKELASSSTIEDVPFAAVSESTPSDGYYTVQSASANRNDPRTNKLQVFDGVLVEAGTRANKRRAVRLIKSQEDHPFGNATTAEVAAPATATQVQWLDRETESTSDPSLVTTRSAELGDVEIYDLQNAPYADATLVYDIPYADEGPVDVRVWDERGVGSRTDSDDVLQWQKVFSTAHEYAGERVISNGLVRLRVDQSPALSVERWDDANSTWTTQSLGTSSWSVTDLDVRHIGMARADARVVFSDGSSEYPLDVSIKRGWTDPLWMEIDGEGGTPAGLVDLLDPAASGQIYDPGADQGLVAREVVQ
ncbi:hypothetical protein [Haloarcula pellucida]|uniref:Uncharacterized protein n=1 Tax=Haloarcula pellucida TaxID=1427151 RepID=A0A830GSX8_9EURY|nr:hypothetical protein [Halomicroarcula pellucida]MBX0350467.1 hypothetical protein [Halomicroarcula pellucida]GGO03462.1 hypothetical protein GCM10009030_39130 [Halomicroarcula pellucida]